MVALTMYIMRWSIVIPILGYMGLEEEMPEWSFTLLVLSTLLITAAGNVINDFHDVRADQINQPDKVVIDRKVSRRKAILAHFMLNSLGVIIGVFICFYHQIYWLSLIFIVVPGLLWWYSIKLKHLPFYGNAVVSLLTGTVPLLVILFEYPLLTRAHQVAIENETVTIMPVVYWILAFAIFAFLSNLIREMVKDGEDLLGDVEAGSRTLAIELGIKRLKLVIALLTFVSLVFLSLIFLIYLPDWISLAYFILLLGLPFVVVLILTLRVKEPKDFAPVSFLVKLIMFFGILYAPVSYFITQNLFG